jgi:hypothetical protein
MLSLIPKEIIQYYIFPCIFYDKDFNPKLFFKYLIISKYFYDCIYDLYIIKMILKSLDIDYTIFLKELNQSNLKEVFRFCFDNLHIENITNLIEIGPSYDSTFTSLSYSNLKFKGKIFKINIYSENKKETKYDKTYHKLNEADIHVTRVLYFYNMGDTGFMLEINETKYIQDHGSSHGLYSKPVSSIDVIKNEQFKIKVIGNFKTYKINKMINLDTNY